MRKLNNRLIINHLWSWRESNPRPNEEAIRFLHAYPLIDCRVQTGSGPPIPTLSPLFSPAVRSLQPIIPDITAPPDQAASGQQHPGDVSLQHLMPD